MSVNKLRTAIAFSLGVTMIVGSGSTTTVFAQASNDAPDIIIDTDSGNTTTNNTNTSYEVPRFTCESSNGQPTVMYQPDSQPGEKYPWAVPVRLGGGWTEARRCDEIARRLEAYRSDNMMELSTRKEGNYDIVCVTSQVVPACRIVFTVPPGQNPWAVRDRVFQNLLTANSGDYTQGVVTYSGQNSIEGLLRGNSAQPANIDLRPFLDANDGGTATRIDDSETTNATEPEVNNTSNSEPEIEPEPTNTSSENRPRNVRDLLDSILRQTINNNRLPF
ncbi:MAG: COP23 domain-containing protein [Oscillatoria sp. PMC 1068.18]|nr:COP23 domain-containing protein [Oscillatoria sp. PMC 1076.18]MEC4988021.1 COP23 domain-containing protein [Oscillatoria sp. PMC 1068.18]